MDRQERKEEREFGSSIMNFSCNEILKFISKVFVMVLESLFFRLLPSFYWPSIHYCSEFFI